MTSIQTDFKVSISAALNVLKTSGLLIRHLVRQPLDKVVSVTTDSRKVCSEAAFLAYRGVATDGHSHLEAAIQNGAELIILEDERFIPENSSWILVSSSRTAWAWLAAEGFGHPQNQLHMIAITGTNGKTSTSWMIRELLKQCGIPTLLIGTLGAWVGDEWIETSHTTPDPDLFYGLLKTAYQRGIRVAVTEAASQSLVHGKLSPIKFSGAGFTSFSRDHLDLHGTMESYLEAKMLLFSQLLKAENFQCAFSAGVLDQALLRPKLSEIGRLAKHGQVCVYGELSNNSNNNTNLDSLASIHKFTYRIRNRSASFTEILVETSGQLPLPIVLPFPPGFLIENFCAAYLLALHAMKQLSDKFAFDFKKIRYLSPVPGRLERVFCRSAFPQPQVLVDYAHTPDALEKALAAVRPLVAGKIILVFGCGGDRDRGKRPEMAAAAERFSDNVIVTSDNPRTESPDQIFSDILKGFSNQNVVKTISDRSSAISAAIAQANANDLVLVAGKGHETYQIIGKQKHQFDDRLECLRALEGVRPKKVLVIGAGVSGRGAAALLRARGHFVVISDNRVLSDELRSQLVQMHVNVLDGGHHLSHLDGIDAVVVSPGVATDHPLLLGAANASLPVFSEIDLALNEFTGTLIAITGTNGKSTVTAMTAHMLQSRGVSATAGGNIGIPPSLLAAQDHLPEYLVLELSSYQLEQSRPINANVGVFTSFSFDHMARHGSMENYFDAKWKLFARKNYHSVAILSEEVVRTAIGFRKAKLAIKTYIVAHSRNVSRNWIQLVNGWDPNAICVEIDEDGRVLQLPNEQAIAKLDTTSLPEYHNQLNAVYAGLSVAHALSIEFGLALSAIGGFRGLPHRCETVGIFAGHRIINDSKSTNVESTMVALASQKQPVILFLGGKGKGESFEPLLRYRDRILRVVTFGFSGKDILNDIKDELPVTSYDTLKEALEREIAIIRNLPAPILFSPGCASFDEFNNFEHRGNFFSERVSALTKGV